MGYVINLLRCTYNIYWSYNAYGTHCYPTLSPYVSVYILYKIYSLYYTMGYVINLLDTYNIY